MNVLEFIQKAYTYTQYRSMIDALMAQGKTTGTDQSEDMISYAKMNQHRMQRIEKTIKLSEELQQAVQNLSKPVTALIITEGWCGDASQIVPVFGAIDALNKNLAIRLVLRDEHLSLMDAFLTNGARAIPKIVFADSESGEVKTVWGPRPAKAQTIMEELKALNASKTEKSEAVHAWYGKDRTVSIQQELTDLIQKL